MFEPTLSIVAPVYNEQETLKEFYDRLTEVLDRHKLDAEIVFVNDGSRDRSGEILEELCRADKRVRALEFSRNFGHQTAVKAGIDNARGKAVVVMDSDLQDPPSVVPLLVEKWKEGYDVVYAYRASRAGENAVKKWTAHWYYRLLRSMTDVDMPVDTGDFRLISREVADVIRRVNDRRPYIRGLVAWAGFRQAGVAMQREKRFAGRTHYSFKQMWRLAWDGLMHFSDAPLRWAFTLGWASVAASAAAFFSGQELLLFAVLFLGGVQLIVAGLFGKYMARTLDQVRTRPLYILRKNEIK